MGAKLRSLLKNQRLRLAFKALILISLIFSWEYSERLIYLLLFLSSLSILYLRPSVNNGKFLAPICAILIGLFLIPNNLDAEVHIYISVISGILLTLIIGLKDLFFINRARVYYLVNLTLVSCANIFLFYGLFDFLDNMSAPILVSVILLRDLYINGLKFDARRTNLAVSIISLIIAQISWLLYVYPIGFLEKSVVSVSLIILINALYVRHLRKRVLTQPN